MHMHCTSKPETQTANKSEAFATSEQVRTLLLELNSQEFRNVHAKLRLVRTATVQPTKIRTAPMPSFRLLSPMRFIIIPPSTVKTTATEQKTNAIPTSTSPNKMAPMAEHATVTRAKPPDSPTRCFISLSGFHIK
mmetsp:Transcript_28683/g.43401  ORF Transcript_28683/g.43401 Transcript_28683/m.43401 type:complete len:135 (-) Transcript_28683:80-484(-)|eukprot:CAMPEP_0195005328 /NCGR_PEP_ID=MMETSP0326_2-20130528/5553_1 /TAXON_ID=2866 ORGANISM="Crypthecodinium cohnii, Strain Seligo" /NCGR_SAMPLE_ID=MMETSP0326_2 /ASSEMBLY_ACC=CAM_ASM_000348 /LENGTH=134 /DNA_ID=CAMNT_0040011313 /DNA_START=337 /DNA_END=741 /DNA_ORIENTATION=-